MYLRQTTQLVLLVAISGKSAMNTATKRGNFQTLLRGSLSPDAVLYNRKYVQGGRGWLSATLKASPLALGALGSSMTARRLSSMADVNDARFNIIVAHLNICLS